MRRLLLLLLLAPLSGCMGLGDNYYYDEAPAVAPSSSCGCNAPGLTSAAPPTISQLPAGQTREPDLTSPRR